MDLIRIYQKLLKSFGKQHWWPAETRFEVIVGTILTQQTNWRNVERAIENLKSGGLLNLHSLATAPLDQIEASIGHLNFFRQKARRINNLSRYLVEKYSSLDAFLSKPTKEIREELLSLKGIGPETADSILLYASDKLIFPIDAYTIRLCKRLGVKDLKYEALRRFFENSLPKDLEVYKEFHALIDKLGKTYCKVKPSCAGCPLMDECSYLPH